MQRQFALRPSRFLATLLFASHAAAFAALIAVNLPLWATMALASLVLLSLGYHLRHDAWLAAPSSAVALTLDQDLVTLSTRCGKTLDGKIMRDSLVTPWLTVLNILPQDARLAHSVVILPDSLDAESFRQLRVRLKWDMAA